MFQLFFKYAPSVYARGHFVLLAAWPAWILLALIALFAAVRLSRPPFSRRGAIVSSLQVLVVALILFLLWQPALSLAQLKPQQNIIAVLVDDSRSMALPDASNASRSREQSALATLQSGLLADLGRRFQTRIYTLDSRVARVASAARLQPTAAATRIGDSLRQFLDQTDDLPIGAIVLLSDGGDNAGGLDRDTIAALRSRQIPVQTIGFGATQMPRDVELENVQIEPSAMAKSRVEATVSLRQHGFAGSSAQLEVRSGQQVLASRALTLGRDGDLQTVNLMFNAGPTGAKTVEFSLAPLAGESNTSNNRLDRLLNVTSDPHRVLYLEGEPRWEYKFIRRAESSDPQIQLVSMLRATENKFYRQGISDPGELAAGFPTRAEDLFRYQGLIIGSVEAAYFTPVQQDLIQAFADRRGGGILFLGGQYSLADGGWGDSSLAPLLPVNLPSHKGTFIRADLSPAATALVNGRAPGQAYPALAPAGADSIITRLVDDPAANAQKWSKLPWLMDYQDAGTPKPGASVLANVHVGGRTLPLLATESYGRGRTAVLATSGTWRWQMNLPLGDPSHDLFWQQLLRWMVAGTPGQVAATVSAPTLFDSGAIHFTAEVRDPQYNPAANAQVQAHILGPGGIAATVPLLPTPNAPGSFGADYTAPQPGAYVAQIGAPGFGQDVVAFNRLDGVAENFHTAQNRDLLQQLAQETGGQYWTPDQAAKLARQVQFSNAGITVRDNLPLWNLPIFFLLLLALPLAEWFLRRKWGVV